MVIGLACPLLFAQVEGGGVLQEIVHPVLKIENLPPHQIPVFDLSPSELQGLQSVKGVTEVRAAGTGAVVFFHPFQEQAWKKRYKWHNEAHGLFKQAPFRTAFGGTPVKDCRRINPRDDAAFPEPLATFNCRITFSKRAQLVLRGFAGAKPGDIEHEMVRDLIGARMWTQRVDGGSVLFARVPAGDIAVWKVNQQLYARLEAERNNALLTACVRRFGSQPLTESPTNARQWASVEIGLRIQQLERAAAWQRQGKGTFVWRFAPYLTDQFPDLFSQFGMIDLRDPPEKTYRWLQEVRSFLLANRMRFRYEPDVWGFVLPGGTPTGMRPPPMVPPQFRDPRIYGKMKM